MYKNKRNIPKLLKLSRIQAYVPHNQNLWENY